MPSLGSSDPLFTLYSNVKRQYRTQIRKKQKITDRSKNRPSPARLKWLVTHYQYHTRLQAASSNYFFRCCVSLWSIHIHDKRDLYVYTRINGTSPKTNVVPNGDSNVKVSHPQNRLYYDTPIFKTLNYMNNIIFSCNSLNPFINNSGMIIPNYPHSTEIPPNPSKTTHSSAVRSMRSHSWILAAKQNKSHPLVVVCKKCTHSALPDSTM